MKILPIRLSTPLTGNKNKTNKKTYISPFFVGQDRFIKTNSLAASQDLQTYNSFVSSDRTERKYKLNLSSDELKKRTDTEALQIYKLLDEDSIEYQQLDNMDKEALKHLVKAARILNNVYFIQDNPHNLEFKNYIESENAKGNDMATRTLKLFNAQKGVCAKDVQGKNINLADGIKPLPQRGFYPEDLSEKEFHEILMKMLDEGKEEQVEKILNQRTMVIRSEDELKGIDYTDFFKEDFANAAHELELAADYSTNEDFRRFLSLQANALVMNNPYMDALADKKWAKLQNTPLEFTITRESYDDKMTPSISKNSELMRRLNELNIIPYNKDNIGVRVGIVNKEGTDYILKIKEYLPLLAEHMPYKDEYEQKISSNVNKQTMVDVDIVEATGQLGAYRGGISIASALPNSDKLAIKLEGGRRNVYHRQMRQAKYSAGIQNRLNAVLDKSQHKYYDKDSLHDFTILHETLHSLGPKTDTELLGRYKNIIEENKADMGAIVMLDVLTKKGFYTENKQKQVFTSFLTAYVAKGANFNDAHRTRNIMQYNYFLKEGAIKIDKTGKMKINFDKVTPAAQKMLNEIIRIQLDKDIDKARQFVNKYAVWTEPLEKMAENLKSSDKMLNATLVSPLADKLATE